MTIKELKKLLKGLPGKTTVYMDDPRSIYFEHIDKIIVEHDNTNRTVFVVLCSNRENTK